MSVTLAGPGPAGSRGRILLVEDDPEVALFAVHVLVKRGQFEVTHTADPAVALQLVVAGCWDLVVTAHAHQGPAGKAGPSRYRPVGSARGSGSGDDSLRRMSGTLMAGGR